MSESAESSRASAAARVLGDVLTAHHKEGSSWAALLEVGVETALLGEQLPSTSTGRAGYVVAVICAIGAGLLILAAGALLFVWCVRKRGGHHHGRRCLADSVAVVEKSNNLQNEENLRRQLSQMKTLNAMELTRCSADPAIQRSKLGQPPECDDGCQPPECLYSSGSGTCDSGTAECALESNPIYKAPSVDVRNNIVAANAAAKEVSVRVLQPGGLQRTLLPSSDVKTKQVLV